MSTVRHLRPRPAVALRASFVSQQTSLQVLGIDDRRYLDYVVPLCRGSVVSLGRLRLIPIDVAEEALRRLAATPTEATDDDDAQPQTADDVLREIGREVAR